MVHQILLHSKESRRQKVHLSFVFPLPKCFTLFNLCKRRRSTTWSRSTRRGTRLLFFFNDFSYIICLELCIKGRFTNKESQYQAGHQIIFIFIITIITIIIITIFIIVIIIIIIIISINIICWCASGVAPQQGVAAPAGGPDFWSLLIFIYLFIIIYCNFASGITPQQKTKSCGTRLQ